MVEFNPLLVETITVTRAASKELLQTRLDAMLLERETRKRINPAYGRSISDQWLERNIATLHEAINLPENNRG